MSARIPTSIDFNLRRCAGPQACLSSGLGLNSDLCPPQVSMRQRKDFGRAVEGYPATACGLACSIGIARYSELDCCAFASSSKG